jgi:hypothetical protein
MSEDINRTGDLSSSTTLALLGDSHALIWFEMFGKLGKQLHFRVKFYGFLFCCALSFFSTSCCSKFFNSYIS